MTELPGDVDAQDEYFNCFKREAKDAFRKYKVIYLRGMQIPVTYDDLIPTPETNYRDVIWMNNVRPRSNTFSVKKDLTSEEIGKLDFDIMTEFQNIVVSQCID